MTVAEAGGVAMADGVTVADEAARQRVLRLGGLRRAFVDVGAFGEAVLRMPLRPYQLEVARAVQRSVIDGQGLTFTVLMPRQAGKNQVSARLWRR